MTSDQARGGPTGPSVAAGDTPRQTGGVRTPPTPARAPLLGMTWAHLLNDGAANYLPGVLPAVLVSLHAPVRLAGVLIAALTVGQALQPVVGWVADRIGGRSLVVTGLLLNSLGGGLLGFAHRMGVLITLLLLIGIGNSFFHPQALAGVRSMLAGRRGLLMAVFLVGGELGRGLWPTVASLVVVHLGLSGLWVVALPGILTVPLLFRWAPPLPPRSRQGQRRRGRHRAWPLSLLIAYRSARALTTYALVTFIPILWHLRGGTLVEGASVITTMLVVGVIGNLGGGHLADMLGRRPVLVASAIATAALIVPVVILQGAAMWLSAGLLGIAMFLTAPTTVLIGQDLFPENRSMGSGIALGLANGIGAVLVLVIGLLVTSNGVEPVLWVVAGIGAASGVCGLVLPRSVRT
ncbi:MAG TPA: MFS transporter [Acidimicrobiales bacterium]|nr:MFS transporter [Acidimicrobiales bacterium]